MDLRSVSIERVIFTFTTLNSIVLNKTRLLSFATCVVGAFTLSFLLTSCATIFSGTSQEVKFESEPSGAAIMVGGVERGTTPATVTLTKPGLSEKRVTFTKEGYEDRSLKLQKSFATTTILNIFGPWLIGWGIDAFSGAMFKYSPTQYNAELEQEGMSSRSSSSSTKVAKAKWYNLDNLEKNSNGNYIIPSHDRAASAVFDTETGTLYTIGSQ